MPIPGRYTIRQKSSVRFLDAHTNSTKDYQVVTRTAQNNDTQIWEIDWDVHDEYKGIQVCTVGQVSTGRFLDAYQDDSKDYQVVTRTAQNNDTQRWVVVPDGTSYTIRQLSSGRFVDAYQNPSDDYQVVTRPHQNNDTQRWEKEYSRRDGVDDAWVDINGSYTFRQKSSGSFLDAYQGSSKDYRVVTRTAQGNNSQRWEFISVAHICKVRQKAGGRYLDAYESSSKGHQVVTRDAQSDDSQYWVFIADGTSYTIRQLSSFRFLDAYQNSAKDYQVVTRTAQKNDTQRWLLDLVEPRDVLY
ncbi:MAG: hypothetical protein GY770_34790 [Aestuariibacter sp.]|nr:hypothetical protein [Aestuariibacter sp.]